MHAALHNSPQFDYSTGYYSPPYAGFASPYGQDSSGFYRDQDLHLEPLADDTSLAFVQRQSMEPPILGERMLGDSRRVTSQPPQNSHAMHQMTANLSYEFTDSSSFMHSGADSMLHPSRYLSTLSMENDTDPAADTFRDTASPCIDQQTYEFLAGQRARQGYSLDMSLKKAGAAQVPLPPPLPESFHDSNKELACSSMLEQTPVYSTADQDSVGGADTVDVLSQKPVYNPPCTYQHAQLQQDKVYSAANVPFHYDCYPQACGKFPCSTPVYGKHGVVAEKIYPYEEQSSLHRQMNYQSFLRSYQYFYGLDDEIMELQHDMLATLDDKINIHQVTPEKPNSSTLYKGLFCANKECCVLLIDNITRSPYCSKQCQVREQNMRQARVKPRETLIRRKHSLLRSLRTLPSTSFERRQIIAITREFLRSGMSPQARQPGQGAKA